ncbi:MAG: SEC-C metal-binding domain-containing protein [Desulfosudaceae bacterium]
MKIGRNDPCPCGSGRKYKKCCLAQAEAPSPMLRYRRLSEAYEQLSDRLLKHASQTFGEDAVYVAMAEFLLWSEEPDEMFNEDNYERLIPLFVPWFLFNWEYDALEAAGHELDGPEGRTVAELYAEKHAGRLDSVEETLITSVNRQPYSFWEVIAAEPGRGITVKDILRGHSLKVVEIMASEYVQPGEMLFGRAVNVDGVDMLVGLAHTRLPVGRKPDVIQLRKRLGRGDTTTITDYTLYDWDMEIRDLFFMIDHLLHAPPQMCNTDGDPMEFHRLIYEVTSADEAFDRLTDLCVTRTAEDLLNQAEKDEEGRVSQIDFPWDRLAHNMSAGLSNTILGRIRIDGRRLRAEVNSARRAEELRRELDTRLGDIGRFQVDEIQDLDAALEERRGEAGAENGGSLDAAAQEELMQLPEVRQQLDEMIGKHWEGWVDQALPALGGKTPRQAIKTADGREAVEALLQEAVVNRGQDALVEANRKGTQRARELLGLKPL